MTHYFHTYAKNDGEHSDKEPCSQISNKSHWNPFPHLMSHF